MASYFSDHGVAREALLRGLPPTPSYSAPPMSKKVYAVSLLYDRSVILYNSSFGTPVIVPPPDAMDCGDGHKKQPMICLLGTSGSRVYIEETFLDKDMHVKRTVIHCFDAQSWLWQSFYIPVRRSKTIHTLGTCSAAEGHHLYVAGGAQRTASMTQFQKLNNVDRMDVRTMEWEALPHMNQKRDGASMVVLQGRIYVIGGQIDGYHTSNSGEVWDPKSGGEWTLVPELCPMEVFGAGFKPKVAVVMETLYAVNETSLEVMRYENNTKVWICIGQVPSLAQHCTSCCPWSCHQVLAMDQELWVVLISLCSDVCATDHRRVAFMTFTCLPNSPPLSWIPMSDKTDGKAMFTSTIELSA